MGKHSAGKGRYRYTKRFARIAAWIIAVVFSAVFIFGGNAFFSRDLSILKLEGATAAKAKITELGELTADSYGTGGGSEYNRSLQFFDAKLLSGEDRGKTVYAVQTWDNITPLSERPVKAGDTVILYNYGTSEGGADWLFGGYSRLDAIIVLGLVFAVLLIVFGRIKGFNTLVSLAFTCLALFAVFLPAVLSGANIYAMTIFISVYIIAMTLVITNGIETKSLTTIAGCAVGVLAAAAMSFGMDRIMHLTGMTDEHSIYLTYFEPPIDLNGVIFAMVVIGALGAVMDVAMDISSALFELHTKTGGMSFPEYWESGLRIGRDVMGTMANSLVLAYIGSSLCSVLLMISYSANLLELLNRESIIVELMNGLVGSLAILLTIPLTTIICAAVYAQRRTDPGA